MQKLVRFLETNTAPDGLFAPDIFCDLSLPQWRIQVDSADAVVQVRRDSHPDTGSVPRSRTDLITDGFVFEFEERWAASGEQWYAREMIRATIRDWADCRDVGVLHRRLGPGTPDRARRQRKLPRP